MRTITRRRWPSGQGCIEAHSRTICTLHHHNRAWWCSYFHLFLQSSRPHPLGPHYTSRHHLQANCRRYKRMGDCNMVAWTPTWYAPLCCLTGILQLICTSRYYWQSLLKLLWPRSVQGHFWRVAAPHKNAHWSKTPVKAAFQGGDPSQHRRWSRTCPGSRRWRLVSPH